MNARFFPTSIRDEPTVLSLHAAKHPDKRALTFLADGYAESEVITYGELHARARRIASALRARGICAGERALLLFPAGTAFLCAYWGCLYAGVAAVIAPPATSRRLVPRLRLILEDSAPSVLLGNADLQPDLRGAAGRDRLPVPWLALDEAIEQTDDGRELSLGEGHIALIQYTSGSTATPKGVVVTHGNLFRNQELIRVSMGHCETSNFVSWLPQFHDMGLIGCLSQPLHLGTDCAFMPPEVFLRSPQLWLRAITKYRAHTSGAPNFAYAYCVERIGPADKAGLDLSSWEVAFNGAEPVRASTMRAFTDAFRDHGFRPSSFYPTYGLAEATLMVTGGCKREGPIARHVSLNALEGDWVVPCPEGEEHATTLVASGSARSDGQQLLIVDPVSRTRLGPDRVGEIWVKSASVAAGYWNCEQESLATFRAQLADGESGFLRTGDLGFVLDGQLFVTGRLKDLIIVRGRNYHPHDIEQVVDTSHDAFAVGCSVAFSETAGDDEHVIVLAEVRPSRLRGRAREAMAAAIAAVAAAFALEVHEIALVPKAALPKTTSGKPQRSLSRKRYREGALRTIDCRTRAGPASERTSRDGRFDPRAPCPTQFGMRDIERFLLDRVARICEVPEHAIDRREPVASLGVDSVKAVRLQHETERVFGVRLPPSHFLRDHSLLQTAEIVMAAASRMPPIAAIEDVRPETHILSAGQRAIWVAHQLAPTSAAYNVFTAVRVLAGLEASQIECALAASWSRHPVLRSTFVLGEDGPVCRLLSDRAPPFEVRECVGFSESDLRSAVSDVVHEPFDLERGPLVRVRWIRTGGEPLLVLESHHIVMDLWSLAQFVTELVAEAKGERCQHGSEPDRPFFEFVGWEKQLLLGSEGERLWTFWQAQLPADGELGRLPTDRERPTTRADRAKGCAFTFDAPATRRMRHAAAHHRVTVHALLLSAWAALLANWTRRQRAVLGGVTSARPGPQFMRTLGQFANPVLLNIDLSGDPSCATLFRRVHDLVSEVVDHQCFPFPWLVQRACIELPLDRAPIFDGMFVYQQLPFAPELAPCILSSRQRKFRLHDVELESVPLHTRSCRYDLTVYVVDVGEELEASILYRADLYEPQSMNAIAGALVRLASAMIDHPSHRLSQLLVPSSPFPVMRA